ncbi:glycosyltransferase [Methanolobus sediminis]|uniref:Glycosyltransferase n=1 Tax=Methanolobus sediminis TaxID=3072978 RepID=A0AA51UIV5_9EURY|nr:glycosyltransferase [Methanolobus sediminis]WMW24309.1 glycosyltransferase [Methanolobus sediminis]
MKSMNPKVTVLMPVYNGEEFLGEAIDSILNQTLNDFEFLIISEHGTSEESLHIINNYKDERIRHLHNKTPLGLVGSLNFGLKEAKGDYIARMDADDFSYPKRLDLQVKLLDRNKKIGICGTWVETIEVNSSSTFRYPTEPSRLQSRLLFDSALAHPSVMFRKIFIDKFGLKYDENDLYAEDWSFWQKSSFIFPITNIPKVLLKYRITEHSTSRFNADKQLSVIKTIHKRNIQNLCSEFTDEDIDLHTELGMWQFKSNQAFIEKSEKWLLKLKHCNSVKKIYPEPEFTSILAERWFFVCRAASKLGLITWSIYWNSPLRKHNEHYKHAYIFIKCIIK